MVQMEVYATQIASSHQLVLSASSLAPTGNTKPTSTPIKRINTMKINNKWRKDQRMTTWNVRSLYRTEVLRMTINELQKSYIIIAAIQETRWIKSTPLVFASNEYNIYNI
jgi:hypothetical protein